MSGAPDVSLANSVQTSDRLQTSDMVLQHRYQICSINSAAWRRRPRAPDLTAQDSGRQNWECAACTRCSGLANLFGGQGVQRGAAGSDRPVPGGRVFSEARPALTKATAGGKAAGTRAVAAEALAMLAFVAAEEPDDVDGVLALLAGLWRDGAARELNPAEGAALDGAGVLACGDRMLETEVQVHQVPWLQHLLCYTRLRGESRTRAPRRGRRGRGGGRGAARLGAGGERAAGRAHGRRLGGARARRPGGRAAQR